MAACVQHELLVRGFPPQHVLVDICKGLNLLSAVILVALIYRAQHLNEIFERIRLHLRLLLPLNLSVRASIILSKPVFWVESVVCFLHLPPFVTFECGVMNWNNFVLYRAETIFMLWNTLRIYLFWKCFIDAVLERLPRRHTVSSFTGVRMNSAFTFKQVLNSEQAVVVIALFWFGQILLLGYWFRAVEATACLFGVDSGSTAQGDYLEPTAVHPGCQEENSYQWRVWIIDGNFDKVNDMYLWNAMWSMFSSSTSVGIETPPRPPPPPPPIPCVPSPPPFLLVLLRSPSSSSFRSKLKGGIVYGRVWRCARHNTPGESGGRAEQCVRNNHDCHADVILHAQPALHTRGRVSHTNDRKGESRPQRSHALGEIPAAVVSDAAATKAGRCRACYGGNAQRAAPAQDVLPQVQRSCLC